MYSFVPKELTLLCNFTEWCYFNICHVSCIFICSA